ncbi:MAG: hypothetical protein E7437_05265 [Ruminococcaceae bacterium]|nr:hypothetical protein [Oscillospiraceae bacterium]
MDVIEMVIDLLDSFQDACFGSNKHPHKRKWVLTVFYEVLLHTAMGLFLWWLCKHIDDLEKTAVIILTVIVVLIFVLFSFLIIRKHRRSGGEKTQ